MALVLLCPLGTQVSRCAILMDGWWHNDFLWGVSRCWRETVLKPGCIPSLQTSDYFNKPNQTPAPLLSFCSRFCDPGEQTLIGIIPNNQRWNLHSVAQNNKTGDCCGATAARSKRRSTLLCSKQSVKTRIMWSPERTKDRRELTYTRAPRTNFIPIKCFSIWHHDFWVHFTQLVSSDTSRTCLCFCSLLNYHSFHIKLN